MALSHKALRPPLLLAALALFVSGCGTSSTTSAGTGPIGVVAAENFWGSIASQLAGTRATVHSVIADAAGDPHSYEPKAGDARALATARLVIVNGLGYDPWAPKLLAANPAPGRIVLTVGDLLGLKEGDNPHRWYDPANVTAVVDAITADLKKLDPRDAAYFEQRRTTFESAGLGPYHRLIARIKARYAGVPVGASESIFALLSPSLGLRLITPPSFMKAISEGTEVSARDTAAVQQQIKQHRIELWVYNSQNATPQIQRLNELAKANGIPVATITETLSPTGATFQDWQTRQLEAIARALHQATGR
jgi:zinc/manganese transport system substrate-binding protein